MTLSHEKIQVPVLNAKVFSETKLYVQRRTFVRIHVHTANTSLFVFTHVMVQDTTLRYTANTSLFVFTHVMVQDTTLRYTANTSLFVFTHVMVQDTTLRYTAFTCTSENSSSKRRSCHWRMTMINSSTSNSRWPADSVRAITLLRSA